MLGECPGNYTNTAIVDPDNTIPEGDETNNMAQAADTGRRRRRLHRLSRSSRRGPADATQGSVIDYALTVNNVGTDPAFNVEVRDDLPAGTTFVSAADVTGGAGAFSCRQAGGSVTCTGGTLDGTRQPDPRPAGRTSSRA